MDGFCFGRIGAVLWISRRIRSASDPVAEITVTPANFNNGEDDPDALPDNPGEVFADRAYRSSHFGDVVCAKGRRPPIMTTGMWAVTKLKRSPP
ncbi:MAG: hypothetical protein WDN46_23350 [Methylocella sp.]